MARLEDLQPNAAVRGILPECLVTVVSVQWFGSEALELTYTITVTKNEILYSLNKPEDFVLAIVEFLEGCAPGPLCAPALPARAGLRSDERELRLRGNSCPSGGASVMKPRSSMAPTPNRNAPCGASGRRCYRRRGDEAVVAASCLGVNPLDALRPRRLELGFVSRGVDCARGEGR